MKKRRLLRTIQVIIVIFVLCFSLPVPFIHQEPAQAASWWDSGWSYSKKITIDHTYVDGDLTNFPILVSNTSSDYSNAQPDGDDFIFVDSTNTTQYNHEIENFNSTTNTLIAWVNITSLSSTVDTVIWLYYGNATCGSQENVAGTWDSNFVGVWHMASSANDSGIDSSCSDWYMTKVNTPHEESGQIGYAQAFDLPDGDYFARLDEPDDWCVNLTITAWWNTTSLVTSADMGVVARDYVYGDFLHRLEDGSTLKLWWAGNGTYTSEITSFSPTIDVWYFTGHTRDNATQKVYHYINNSMVEVDDYTLWVRESVGISGGDLSIGSAKGTTSYSPFNGTIDEIRVSNINRSESWIKTEYNTSFYPTTFLSVGSEQSESPANNAPVQSGEVPTNSSTGISLTPDLFVLCTDADGDNLNVTWWSNSSGAWVQFASNWTSFASGTNITQGNSNFSAYSTTYWWSVNLTDGTDWINETYSFTTEAAPPWSNTAPTLTSEVPANASTGISRWCQLNVAVTDADGNNSNVYWYTNASGSWYLMQTNNTILNATVRLMNFTNASSLSTMYWWRVSANDTNSNTTETYHFTTVGVGNQPIISTPDPSNGSTGETLFPALGVTVTDADADTMNLTWYSNVSGSWEIIGTNLSDIGNGTYYQKFDEFAIYGLTYYWNMSVTDGTYVVDSGVFSFTAETVPSASGGGGGSMVSSTMGVIGICGIFGLLGFIMHRRRRER